MPAKYPVVTNDEFYNAKLEHEGLLRMMELCEANIKKVRPETPSGKLYPFILAKAKELESELKKYKLAVYHNHVIIAADARKRADKHLYGLLSRINGLQGNKGSALRKAMRNGRIQANLEPKDDGQ